MLTIDRNKCGGGRGRGERGTWKEDEGAEEACPVKISVWPLEFLWLFFFFFCHVVQPPNAPFLTSTGVEVAPDWMLL